MGEAILSSILAAVVTGVISIIGTIAAIHITAKQNRIKQQADMDKQQALLKADIDHVKEDIQQIKEDLKAHNGYARMFSETIPVVKEQIKVANHRIEDLEKKVG